MLRAIHHMKTSTAFEACRRSDLNQALWRRTRALILAMALASSSWSCAGSETAEYLNELAGDDSATPVGSTPPPNTPPPSTLPLCGEGTVLVEYETRTGSRMTFCRHPTAGISASELGLMDGDGVPGDPVAAPDRPQCMLDIFLETAPSDLPIPEELREACVRNQSGSGEAYDEEETDMQGRLVSKSHYCGSGGASEFAQDISDGGKCYDWWDYNGYRRKRYCFSGLYVSHTRSFQGQIGTYGNSARETMASCGGSSRHWVSVAGGGTGCASCQVGSATVNSGYWQTWHYECPGSLDCGLSYFGEKISSNAAYRFGGWMIDWYWP